MVRVTVDVERPEPIGQTVGNYKILRKLSTGGMGTVYYAEHALIGRSAAVKVLHPELSGSKDVVNRFFNEAKATTSIKHPGIVEIFDYGYLPTGDGYIIMEFLDGVSLARRLKKGNPYGEGEAAMLVRGVCSALAAAHQKGIVHRDLKPDNIFLVEDADSPTAAPVLDFGIAKLTDVGLAGGTKTGAVMGTPTYMSPEQCRGTGRSITAPTCTRRLHLLRAPVRRAAVHGHGRRRADRRAPVHAAAAADRARSRDLARGRCADLASSTGSERADRAAARALPREDRDQARPPDQHDAHDAGAGLTRRAAAGR
jgi:serine/threonine protein kinase